MSLLYRRYQKKFTGRLEFPTNRGLTNKVLLYSYEALLHCNLLKIMSIKVGTEVCSVKFAVCHNL